MALNLMRRCFDTQPMSQGHLIVKIQPAPFELFEIALKIIVDRLAGIFQERSPRCWYNVSGDADMDLRVSHFLQQPRF